MEVCCTTERSDHLINTEKNMVLSLCTQGHVSTIAIDPALKPHPLPVPDSLLDHWARVWHISETNCTLITH